jgi:uncharacterized membrane protein YhaH (DUF805 family)
MKKYLLGRYRLNRAKYWTYVSVHFIFISLVITTAESELSELLIPFFRVFVIALFLFPIYSLTLARIHDVGYSGWSWFWVFIPFIGAIIVFNILIKKGQHYTNEWGVNPNDKYEGEYSNNKRNGEGTCYFANGDIYIGQFKDDHMHGKGIYKHTDGTIDEGLWEDDNYLDD